MRWERAILVLALAAGAVLRLPQLSLRPMHTDEAVHGIKFGTLLEQGLYRYDRNEYHGPTLNYFTLLPAWLGGQKSVAEVDEGTLRVVPVFFGLCLLFLIPLLPGAGVRTAPFAVLLAACSPALVFYSRYYIQETLLVCFSIGAIVAAARLADSGKLRWATAAGLCAGLMFATKETWIISCGAMGMAFLVVLLLRRLEGRQGLPVRPRHLAVGVLCGGIVSTLLFSSFLTNWQGIPDSFLAYQTYFSRAGESVRHGHPWHYYLHLLLFSRGEHGPVWTEAAIVLPGLAGIVLAFRRDADARARDLRMFLAVYTVLMLVVLSAIPYKTPWVVLGALVPLILMSGYGLQAFWVWCEKRKLKAAGILLVGTASFHLAWQAYEASYVYYDDPVNPYVYSHPQQDVREIGRLLCRLAESAAAPVQVIAGGDDYWPLPWYLRGLPRVGWWSEAGEGFAPAPIILVTPDDEPALLTRLYEFPPPGSRNLYVPFFDRPMFLRPGKEMRGYVTLDLQNRLGLRGRPVLHDRPGER